MNTKHRVYLKDFIGYTADEEIAGSYGQGSHKSLIGRTWFLSRDVRFIVKENRTQVLETNSLELAIEKYNELP